MFYNLLNTLTTPICIELGWLLLAYGLYRLWKAQKPSRRR